MARRKYPRHESRKAYARHRKNHTHERRKHLYRDGAKAKELREFQKRYGKERGAKVYGATVGKVYRERYHHGYAGGRYPEGREGAERPRRRRRGF